MEDPKFDSIVADNTGLFLQKNGLNCQRWDRDSQLWTNDGSCSAVLTSNAVQCICTEPGEYVAVATVSSFIYVIFQFTSPSCTTLPVANQMYAYGLISSRCDTYVRDVRVTVYRDVVSGRLIRIADASRFCFHHQHPNPNSLAYIMFDVLKGRYFI